MASGNERTRPRWFWPLIAFLVGLLVGWLVIGWGIWPVTWKNTLPRDLRAAERQGYLTMVAESLTADGDTALAQERVASWSPEDLAKDLTQLQTRLAREDALQSEQVKALANALGVDLAGAGTEQSTAAQPAAGLMGGFQWRRVCTTALWALLVLAGIAAIVFLYRRWRASQVHEPVPAIRPTPKEAFTWDAVDDHTPAQIAEEAKSTWPAADAGGGSTSRSSLPPWDEREAAPEDEEIFRPPPRATGQPAESAGRGAPVGAAAGVAAGAGRAAAAPVPSGALTKMTEVRALYQMGESDYDEAFDIKDSAGAYIGECGVALVDPVGRGHDQAAALQVWLWDKNDPDTKVKVLMGEGAYRDTVLRDQLAKDHLSLSVKPGAVFELDSYNLLLRGTVEKLDYAELEPAYGVFAELQLLLQVFRKG
jgi:hypothetical protein